MSDFWENEELVGKIEKSAKEEIHIKKVEKNGRKYVDIRVFWLDKDANDFRPSGKGIAVSIDHFEEFMEIMQTIEVPAKVS